VAGRRKGLDIQRRLQGLQLLHRRDRIVGHLLGATA